MRIKKKKILSTLLLSGILIMPTFFSIGSNVDYVNSNSFQKNAKVVNNDEVKANEVVPTFGQDNKNQSNITPNGILSINNNVINLTLYNNITAWSFDIMKSDFMLNLNSKKTKPSSISNVGIKYNTYTRNTVFVYGVGHYPTENDKNKADELVPFLFQINLSTGTPYLLNNSYPSSIITSTNYPNALKNSIDWVVLNQNDGTFFVFSKSQDSAQKTITKFSSINYSSVNIDSSNLNTLLNGNKLINVSNLYGNYFAISTISNQQPVNGNQDVDFYIFDYNLTQLTEKQTINSTKSVENAIAEPITFTSSNNSIITIVLPFVTDGFTNDLELAKKLNIFRFSPNESDSSNNGKKKIEKASIDIGKSEDTNNGGTSSNQYAYAYRVDQKNKRLFVTTIDNNSQKLYCYNFDQNTGKYSSVYEITNFTNGVTAKVNEKKINNFFIVNDANVDTNSYIIREELTFSTNEPASLTNVDYYSGKITVNSNATLTDISKLDSYSFKSIEKAIKDNQLEKHLPSDLKENDLVKMVQFVNSEGQEITGVTKNLSKSSPVNYNDVSGTISVVIEYKVSNWWNKNTSISFTIPITASGFYTRDSLSFKLVKNANDNSQKWNEITALKSKLPSKITKQDIMKSFYIAGSNLKIEENHINISSAQKTDQQKEDTSNQNAPIQVIANDDDGTLLINYNLTSISSSNMPVDNIIGSYKYSGFLRTGGWDKVTLNTNIFNSLKKNKLAYQITKKDIINSLNLNSYYSRNESDWELTVDNADQSTAQFKENVINGKMSFTIKYKATENGVPETIPAENYTISVGKEKDTTSGSGFMTLEEYVGEKITLDTTRMNELTSSMTTENISKNINNLISDYSTAKNNWVDVSSQFNFTMNNEQSTDNKLIYSVNPKDEMFTNINVVLSDGNTTKLKLDKDFQDKLLKKRPNLFKELEKVDVNANITVYNWNYGVSNSLNTIAYKDLYNDSSPQNINYNYVLPSSFVDSFPTDQELGKIQFQKSFNLLKEFSKTNEQGQIDKSDVTYYEIKYIQLIPDNESGIVIVNYTVEYPNIKNSSGFTVTINPQMIISGFKTTGQIKSDFNTILLSVVISLIVLALFTIIVMRVKRNKFVNASKTKGIKYSKIKRAK